MKHQFRFRTILMLLVLVAVAPCMAVMIYSSVALQRDEAIKAQVEVESAAKLVAATQQQWAESARQALTAVANAQASQRIAPSDTCGDFLKSVRSYSASYTNIGVVDLNGKLACQTLKGIGTIDLSNRRYFKRAITSRQFAVGDYMVGFSTGRKILGFGMPVNDDSGAIKGVAYATVDLEMVNRQLQSIDLPKSVHIAVTDDAAIILLSNAEGTSQIGHLLTDPVLQDAIKRRQGAQVVRSGMQNEIWLHALRPLGGAGGNDLWVVASVPLSDAVAIANNHFRLQLSIMVAASLSGLLLAWFLAQHSLERPIQRLLNKIQLVKQRQEGDFEPQPLAPVQPTVIESTELVELNKNFCSMLAVQQTHQKQLLKAQQIAQVGFYQLDLKTLLYSATPIVSEIFGLDRANGPITIAQYEALLHPDDRAMVKAHRDRLFKGGQPLHLQYRVVHTSGAVRWIDAFGFVERGADGTPVLYSGAIQDITDRINSEQAAQNKEKQYQLLFDNGLDGVLQITPEGTILAANPAACQIFGMSEQALQAIGRKGVVALDDPRLQELLDEREAKGRASGQLTMIRGDGSRFEAELTTSIYTDASGSVVGSIVLRDITSRMQAAQEINQLAFYDALTGLPNRRMLMDRLSALVALSKRSGHVGAVIFMDLDHFKNVNDARGHATGDALLRLVTQRLTKLMREEDTVARIGGDEFVILLPGLSQEFGSAARQAMVAAEKLRETLTQPFQIEGQQYTTSGSIGVTLLPKAEQTAADFLREADTAMYRAKNAGRNRIAFFEDAMQFEVESRLAMANDLAQAIGTNQLEMLMQPQFNAQGEAVGGELLMRWMHPTLGPIPPANFIPVAEESGLILQMGDWVLREGCLALLRLQQAGRPMTISVNVSPRQFRQADFVERVQDILQETGASASGLIFEVTEGLLIDNIDETIQRMEELVAMGIRFSIDDFGTGYSSLGYLRRLPLHELKIDRSFVQDTPNDPGSTAIVQSILSMANHLDLHVVAEGVETEDQATFLREAGCTSLQGYLFARPMRIETWLQCELVVA